MSRILYQYGPSRFGCACRDTDRGYFIEPTVFADVSNQNALAPDEIFGPVLCVIPDEDDDDAVRIANDSRYGLSGAVSAGDLDRANAIARRIRSGTMSVNAAGSTSRSMRPSAATARVASGVRTVVSTSKNIWRRS